MKEKIKKLYFYKELRVIAYIFGVLCIAGVIFQVGVFIGYHKANFGREWGDHYRNNFGMERPDSFKGMIHGKLPSSHGALGKVLKVSLPTFIVQDKDGTEKTILINEKTLIRLGMQNASSSSLTSDNLVIVFGEPTNQGQIEAKLIRIMPSGFDMSTSSRNHMMFGR